MLFVNRPTENKKGGAGKGNWGDLKEEVVVGEEEIENTTTTTTTESTETEVVKEDKVVEKEPEYLSFEDHEAQKAEQQRLLEEKYGTTSVRKVDNSWTKGLVIHKKVENAESQTSQEPTKKQQGGRKVVNAAEVFTFVTPSQQRGERGGRGRFNNTNKPSNNSQRRKGGKVPQRGGVKQRGLDTTDQSSFPSLTGN